jgi:hypothetical protein
MSTLTLIPPRLVPAVEKKCRPLFELVAEGARGRATAQDFIDMCKAGDRQLWVVDSEEEMLAIGLSEFVIYPRQKLCRITAVAGHERERWTNHLHAIELWAKDQGCKAMQTVTRPGWSRTLKERGYLATHVVTEKFL